MSAYNSIRATAQAAIDEALANAEAQQPFSGFLTKYAAHLFEYGSGEGKEYFKQELQRLLRVGAPDPTIVYRGLLIQLNGVFEGFIKSLVSAHVANLTRKVNNFGELDVDFQESYAVRAGEVMTRIHEGAINGVRHDFTELLESVGSCFSKSDTFTVKGDVFTVVMGNCTPERLEKVFKQVGLEEPFGDPVGRHKAIQALYSDGKARRAANQLRQDLESQIESRNDLVHGLATKAVVLSEVQESCRFFSAIIHALSDSASGTLK